jgi:hypothetical protein
VHAKLARHASHAAYAELESGWLSLVGLNNSGFLSGADRGRPRVDMRDYESK